jgi:hypothetical protein
MRKHLLLVEVGVCFLPVILQLMLGLLIAPMQIFFLATAESKAKLGALGFLALVATGICGLVALHSVLKWLVFQSPTTLKPKTVLCLMAIGVLPLIVFAPYATTNALGVVTVILPLVCSAHLAWLARDYLFGTSASPDAPGK